MSNTRLISLLGLGFGDCGKGIFTDFLCRELHAHTVVRFNGGAQAGHNVVLPDGRHHTFSQFGSGTFAPCVKTVLSSPVIVHPTALLVEAEHLQRLGVSDCLQRILIDERCRITTPFHQAAGRLRELARGVAAHGSCGVGVGETVRHGLEHPEHVLRYGDLVRRNSAVAKLEAIRRDLLSEFDYFPAHGDAAYEMELHLLQDADVSRRWLELAQKLVSVVPSASRDAIAEQAMRPGTVLFEGAQGVLLDEWRGFHPHTTWSTISTEAVEAVAAEWGEFDEIRHFGLLRSYMTRHGAGPLPTWDADLDCLAEPHNASDGWQGRFRRGHPDAVLLGYALSVVGKLDGLCVSHLDAFERADRFNWCDGYDADLAEDDAAICLRDPRTHAVSALKPSAGHDLKHQEALTRLLASASPRWDRQPIRGAEELIGRVEQLSGCPVKVGSSGPSFESAALRSAF